jgi:hypothetical protein
MKKTLLSLTLLCAGLLGIVPLFATHDFGMRLSYECLTGQTYRIYLTRYYECAGSSFVPVGTPGGPIPGDPSDFRIRGVGNSCGNASATSNWNTVSYSEITPVCPDTTTFCGGHNSAFAYDGVAEHTIYRDYDLSALSCDSVLVSYGSCCRSTSLTTSTNPSFNLLYMDISIDLSASSCDDSSPVFYENPPFIICGKDSTTMNIAAWDPDGDSISYHLVSAFSVANQPYSYLTASGYTPETPLGNTWKVELDSISGELLVAPQTTFNIDRGVIVVEARSYRDGIQNGSSKMDFMIMIFDCGTDDNPRAEAVQINSGGHANGPFHIVASTGNPLDFTISFTDSNSNVLTLYSDFANQLPGATISTTGSNPLNIHLQWSPDTTYLGRTIYAGPTVTNDNCPYMGLNYQAIRFDFTDLAVNGEVTYSSCQDSTGEIDLTVTGGSPPYTYSWSNGDTSQDLTALLPGNYMVEVEDQAGFVMSQAFTVEADSQNLLPTVAVNWTVSVNDEITFDAGAANATSYLWTFNGQQTSTDSQPTFDVSGLDSAVIVLEASNLCGTTLYDTVIYFSTQLELKNAFGKVEVIPHPMNEKSMIRFQDNGQAVNFTLFDIKGQVVKKKTAVSGGQLQLQKEKLKRGLYLFSLERADGATYHGKLMVE